MTNAYRPTSDLVHDQVALYEATEGREGGSWRAGRWSSFHDRRRTRLARFAEFRVTAGDREIPVMVLESL